MLFCIICLAYIDTVTTVHSNFVEMRSIVTKKTTTMKRMYFIWSNYSYALEDCTNTEITSMSVINLLLLS